MLQSARGLPEADRRVGERGGGRVPRELRPERAVLAHERPGAQRAQENPVVPQGRLAPHPVLRPR